MTIENNFDLAEYDRTVNRMIAQHGFMVQAVMSEIPFAYTIGMSARGEPDFVLRLPIAHEDAHSIIHQLIAQWREDPEILDGRLVSKVLNGLPVRLECVPYQVIDEHLCGARRYALEHMQVPVVYQIVCPDARGLFPGEPGCDPKMVEWQSWPDEQPQQRPQAPH